MLRYIIAVTAILITCALPARAQTIKQANNLASFLEKHTEDLGQASRNFTSMQAGLNGNESISAGMVYDSVIHVEHYFDQLYIVVTIYSMMQDSRDQATVKKYVATLSAQAIKSSELSLNVINRELARLSSPAVISEAQKMRDLIIKIRDEIQRIVPSK